MAERIVRVVEDGTLVTSGGWAVARTEDTGDRYFLVEKSAATDPVVLNEAWRVAAQLEIEQAVRDGIVEYCEKRPPAEG